MRKTRAMQLGERGLTHYYHVVSRVVDRRKVLDPTAKEVLLKMLVRQETFTGLRVVAWCIMGNHFHLLIEVPDKEQALEGWTEESFIDRLELIESETQTRKVLADVKMWRENGNDRELRRVADSVRDRLFDLSAFMKELKQRFSIWFNRSTGRCGTLWEERFRSTLVEPGQALRAVAAYIDLNPVRAGLVSDPKDYRWCSYAAAVAGSRVAREGLGICTGETTNTPWKTIGARYRVLLYDKGEARLGGLTPSGGKKARRGFTRAEIESVVRSGGKLKLAAALRCRVRYFTAGIAIGTEAFLDRFFHAKRGSGLFGASRETGPRKMRGAEWGQIHAMRDLSHALVPPQSSSQDQM